jgi:hypothetical protein
MSDAAPTLDFSVPGSPERWLHAAAQSGDGAVAPALRPRRAPLPVRGHRGDPLGGLLAGIAMAMVVGLSWFLVDTGGATTSPWIATGTGLLIGLAVRLGSGPHDRALRAGISLLLYLVTTLTVSFLAVRHHLAQLDPDLPFGFEERVFVRNRLLDPAHALATAGGAWLAMQASYLRPFRR